MPLLTVKGGELIEPDRRAAEDFSNWSLEGAIHYDAVPDAAAALSGRQREFVARLARVFAGLDEWKGVPGPTKASAARKRRWSCLCATRCWPCWTAS